MKVSIPKQSRKGASEFGTLSNKRMNFADQFNSFLTSVSIEAGELGTIQNNLKNKNGKRIVPGGWIVVSATGTSKDALGKTPTDLWNVNRIYLKNFSSNDGTFLIRFFEKNQDEKPFLFR